jgi:hypothetical protein
MIGANATSKVLSAASQRAVKPTSSPVTIASSRLTRTLAMAFEVYLEGTS